MENPEKQIPDVIRLLTQGTREEQKKALNDYFLPNAYFVHPFCRVPSFEPKTFQVPFTNRTWTINSRWLVLLIYQWYRILSPKILLEVDSTAFDRRTNSLYATIRQTFTIWIVPFSLWQANVQLVCLLELAHLPVDDTDHHLLSQDEYTQQDGGDNTALSSKKRYFVRGQQDHYQVNEFLKFIAPFGASVVWYLWQLFATFLSAVGVALLWPVTSVYEHFSAQRRDEPNQKHSPDNLEDNFNTITMIAELVKPISEGAKYLLQKVQDFISASQYQVGRPSVEEKTEELEANRHQEAESKQKLQYNTVTRTEDGRQLLVTVRGRKLNHENVIYDNILAGGETCISGVDFGTAKQSPKKRAYEDIKFDSAIGTIMRRPLDEYCGSAVPVGPSLLTEKDSQEISRLLGDESSSQPTDDAWSLNQTGPTTYKSSTLEGQYLSEVEHGVQSYDEVLFFH
ncbi:hypothetical protein F5Y19DRAFT_471609 [Xylariaceae sp. FL1651]|nr:hypothetical protein F5Y19DRAFT_471609 [Xylariaceae sp. FL1651]